MKYLLKHNIREGFLDERLCPLFFELIEDINHSLRMSCSLTYPYIYVQLLEEIQEPLQGELHVGIIRELRKIPNEISS